MYCCLIPVTIKCKNITKFKMLIERRGAITFIKNTRAMLSEQLEKSLLGELRLKYKIT